MTFHSLARIRRKTSLFPQCCQQLPDNIKFTYEFSKERANFLDVTFMTYQTEQGWQFCCKTYQKPLNLYHYIHAWSDAPKHQLKHLIVGECIRYARTCTNPSSFYHMVSVFIKRLVARGHKLETITKWSAIVLHNSRNNRTCNTSSHQTVCKPILKCLLPPDSQLLKEVILQGYNRKFAKPLFCFTRHPKLRDQLVKSKFGNFTQDELFDVLLKLWPLSGIRPTEVPLPEKMPPRLQTGVFTCKRKTCKTCVHMPHTSFFTSKITGKKFLIRHRFSCNSKMVIYLISCSYPKCNKQYVGRTTQKLSNRVLQHLSNINLKRGSCLHKHFFLIHLHIKYLTVTPIDSAFDQEDLDKLEHFWIDKLKTYRNFGLNVVA